MKLGLTDNQYKNLLILLQEQAEAPAAEPEKGTSDKQAGGQGYPQVGKWESGVTRGPGNQIGITKWADVVGAKLNRGKANPLKEQTETATESNPENVKMMLGAPQPKPPVPAKQIYGESCKYYEYGECPFEMKTRGGDLYYWYYHSESPKQTWAYVDELHGAGHGSKSYKLGNYNNNDFVGTLDDMTGYYEMEFDWWLKANMNTTLAEWKRYHGRVSKSGKTVPKGFNPDKYDEYLSKVGLIQQQIDSIDKKHKSNWNPFKSNFGPGGYWDKKELNNYNNLKQQLVDLKNEYSNDEFSYGVTKPELEQYNQKVKETNDFYTNKINEWSEKQNPTTELGITTNVVSGTISPTSSVDDPPELRAIKDEWNKQIGEINLLFGKDSWSKDVSVLGQDFDRIWDKWGTAIQVVGNIALIAVSGGIAGIVRGAAGAVGFALTSGVIRAAAPYVADATFNGLVGLYERSRGKNEEAAISFLCAMVPYISWSKNIGKVSIETCEGLAKKLILNKYDTKEDMQLLINSLTPEERYIFRDVMSLPKEAIKDNFDLAIKRITKSVGNEGLIIPKAGASVWGPKLLKQFGIEGSIPVSGILVNSFFNVIKNTYGHIYSEDELIKVKQFLENLKTMNNIELLSKASIALEDLKLENITKENKPDLVQKLGESLGSKYKENEIPDDVLKEIRNKKAFKLNAEKIINQN